MEFIGGMIGLSIAWWSVAIVVASLLFPIFWVWMLVDSILRNDHEYPGGDTNEKLVWVLLIALVQFVAVFYFFAVYRKAGRRSGAAARQYVQPSTCPPASGAASSV